MNAFRTVLALFLSAILLAPACKRDEVSPTPEVLARYQADADRFCRAMVECIKADVARRLADRPDRSKMITARMDQELCLKGQTQMLGKLSVDPAGATVPFRPEQYEDYSACTKAVVEASDCMERRAVHRSFPACERLRAIHEG